MGEHDGLRRLRVRVSLGRAHAGQRLEPVLDRARLGRGLHRHPPESERLDVPQWPVVNVLQLAEGVPVVTVTRVAYGEDGTPLEMNDMGPAADRYELSYEWPAA